MWTGTVRQKHQYSTPSPDWIDEVGAISSEPQDLRPFDAKEAIPLSVYFAMEHPMAPAGGMSPVEVYRFISNREGGSAGFAADSLKFYSQGAWFAEFLRQNAPALTMKRIALALRDGETIEHWLAAHGAEVALGSSVAELENRWTAWLSRKSGQ